MRPRTTRLLGGATLAVALATGGAVWFLRYRTDHTTTPIGIDEAVAAFGLESTPATGVPDAPDVLPAPGVYVYDTVGGDGVDALGGASHDYPATTTITVTPAECGVTQTWVAAEERSDSSTSCVDADGGAVGVAMVAFTQFHRFFGADDREEYRCTGGPRPIGAPAGTTWQTTCERDGEIAVWNGEVLAPTTVGVAGEPVAVDHVVSTIDNGDPDDSQRTETWYLAGTDLVVRRVIDVTTVEGSPIGTVHYTEHAELALTSLTPAS